MPGQKPTHRVCVPEKNGDDETYFTEIGSGWSFQTRKAAGVSIKLKPGIAVMGELVLFEIKPDE